jgi:quinolinate synthase
MVHEIFSVQDLLRAKKRNPDAIVIAHPECPRAILEHTDFIGGTEKMRRHVMSVEQPTTFLVGTEANMIHAFEKSAPRHTFVPIPGLMTDTGETCACNRCPHMARNTLAKVRDCLKHGEPEIHWQPYFADVREVLQRSLL